MGIISIIRGVRMQHQAQQALHQDARLFNLVGQFDHTFGIQALSVLGGIPEMIEQDFETTAKTPAIRIPVEGKTAYLVLRNDDQWVVKDSAFGDGWGVVRISDLDANRISTYAAYSDLLLKIGDLLNVT